MAVSCRWYRKSKGSPFAQTHAPAANWCRAIDSCRLQVVFHLFQSTTPGPVLPTPPFAERSTVGSAQGRYRRIRTAENTENKGGATRDLQHPPPRRVRRHCGALYWLVFRFSQRKKGCASRVRRPHLSYGSRGLRVPRAALACGARRAPARGSRHCMLNRACSTSVRGCRCSPGPWALVPAAFRVCTVSARPKPPPCAQFAAAIGRRAARLAIRHARICIRNQAASGSIKAPGS